MAFIKLNTEQNTIYQTLLERLRNPNTVDNKENDIHFFSAGRLPPKNLKFYRFTFCLELGPDYKEDRYISTHCLADALALYLKDHNDESYKHIKEVHEIPIKS